MPLALRGEPCMAHAFGFPLQAGGTCRRGSSIAVFREVWFGNRYKGVRRISSKKVPEQRGLPFSGSTWQTAAYRTQRPNRHCCRSKGAATPRVNGLLHSEPYSAARTRLPLERRLRAFLLASPAASASRRRNRLRRLLARLPAAGAFACCSGWGYRVSPITVCYYTPSMTALSRGSPRIGGF
jgi:hypothetical protein